MLRNGGVKRWDINMVHFFWYMEVFVANSSITGKKKTLLAPKR